MARSQTKRPRKATTSTTRRPKPGTKRVRDFEHGTFINKDPDDLHLRVHSFDPITGKDEQARATGKTPEEALAKAVAKAHLFEGRRAALVRAGELKTVGALGQKVADRLAGDKDAGAISKRYADDRSGIVRNYVQNSNYGLADLHLSAWTTDKSGEFLNRARTAGLSPARVENLGQVLKLIVATGHNRHLLLGNPMAQVKYKAPAGTAGVPRIDRLLNPTPDECAAMEHAWGVTLGSDWGVMLEADRYLMARYGELIAFGPDDFISERPAEQRDVRAGRARRVGQPVESYGFRIQRSIEEGDDGVFTVKSTKSSYTRIARMPDHIGRKVKPIVDRVRRERGGSARILARPDGGGPTLVRPRARVLDKLGINDVATFTADGTPDRKWWARQWLQAYELAGLTKRTETTPRWRIHTWRHVGASYWLFDTDVSHETVRRMGGWTSVKTMYDIYGGEDSAALDRLDDTCALPLEDRLDAYDLAVDQEAAA